MLTIERLFSDRKVLRWGDRLDFYYKQKHHHYYIVVKPPYDIFMVNGAGIPVHVNDQRRREIVEWLLRCST